MVSHHEPCLCLPNQSSCAHLLRSDCDRTGSSGNGRGLGCNASKMSLRLLSFWRTVEMASFVFGDCCQGCIGPFAFHGGLFMPRSPISIVVPCSDCLMRSRFHPVLLQSLLRPLLRSREALACSRTSAHNHRLQPLLGKTYCTSRSSSCTSPTRKPWVPSIPGHHTGHTRGPLGRCRRPVPVWASAWEQAWWKGCPGWGWTRRCRCRSTSAPRVRGSGTGARC